MIDKEKIVFITVDWMKRYQGITEDDIPLGTGGSYPKEEKHEVFNFLDDNGVCYGYTTPHGRITLNSICKKAIKKSPDGKEYIENVLVIFNASNNDGNKRRVVGFYLGATIFNEPYDIINPKRIISSTNTFASYNIRVKAENAYLIEEPNERNFYLPYSKKMGHGYGQSNLWYANDKKSEKFRDEIIKYVEGIIAEVNYASINEEERYLEGEIVTKVKHVNSIKRNDAARRKCLEHYFPDKNYKCKLCNFDFKEKYGNYGEGYIQVHHIKSLTIKSKTEGEHEVDPIKDLIPVCSNCHSIIHKGNKILSVEKMREILNFT